MIFSDEDKNCIYRICMLYGSMALNIADLVLIFQGMLLRILLTLFVCVLSLLTGSV